MPQGEGICYHVPQVPKSDMLYASQEYRPPGLSMQETIDRKAVTLTDCLLHHAPKHSVIHELISKNASVTPMYPTRTMPTIGSETWPAIPNQTLKFPANNITAVSPGRPYLPWSVPVPSYVARVYTDSGLTPPVVHVLRVAKPSLQP